MAVPKVKIDRAHLAQMIAQSGLKKSELAKRIGVANETISRWLSGKTDSASKTKIDQLYHILQGNHLAKDIAIGSFEQSELNQNKITKQVVCALDEELWLGMLLCLCTNSPWLHHRIAQNYDHSWFAASIVALYTGRGELSTALPSEDAKFEVDAKIKLVKAIVALQAGNYEDARRCLENAVLKAQSEWLASICYCLSALTELLSGRPKSCVQLSQKTIAMAAELEPGLGDVITVNSSLLLSHAYIHLSQYEDLQRSLRDIEKSLTAGPYVMAWPRLQLFKLFASAIAGEAHNLLIELTLIKDQYDKMPAIFWGEFQYIVAAIDATDASLSLTRLYQDII